MKTVLHTRLTCRRKELINKAPSLSWFHQTCYGKLPPPYTALILVLFVLFMSSGFSQGAQQDKVAGLVGSSAPMITLPVTHYYYVSQSVFSAHPRTKIVVIGASHSFPFTPVAGQTNICRHQKSESKIMLHFFGWTFPDSYSGKNASICQITGYHSGHFQSLIWDLRI
jgi:hypothetical protein